MEQIKSACMQIWESTPDTFPLLRTSRTGNEQAVNDSRLMAFIGDAVSMVKGFRGTGDEDPRQWGSALKKLIYDLGVNSAGLSSDNMRLLLDGGFCDVTSDFISKARGFDPSFKLDDILQSLRNVWIMNCIQQLAGSGIGLTPSVMAYSMLYPYTDNFIDTGRISSRKKDSTNSNLGRRLSGEKVAAKTPLEEKLFRLIGMIEAQYERSRFPMVYQSLMWIHDAQVRSMLQDGPEELTREDILDISAEKGGSSVLADGCLVRGSLSDAQAAFIFSFGLILQLVDDLQDVKTDSARGHRTLFSMKGDSRTLQGLTNKLINFSVNVMDTDNSFCGTQAEQLKELIKKSMLLLIMGAVACNDAMYEKEYLSALQEQCPFSFKVLKSSYNRIGKEYGRLKLKFSVKPLEIQMAAAFASGRLSLD